MPDDLFDGYYDRETPRGRPQGYGGYRQTRPVEQPKEGKILYFNPCRILRFKKRRDQWKD